MAIVSIIAVILAVIKAVAAATATAIRRETITTRAATMSCPFYIRYRGKFIQEVFSKVQLIGHSLN